MNDPRATQTMGELLRGHEPPPMLVRDLLARVPRERDETAATAPVGLLLQVWRMGKELER